MKITYLKPLTTLTTWVLLASASLHAAAQDRTLPAKTGTQWYPYLEWRLENPSVEGNPFDVGAEAVFVHHEYGRDRHDAGCSTTAPTRGPSASPAPTTATGPSAPPATTPTSTAGRAR